MGASELDRLVASTTQLIAARQELCESLDQTRKLELALSNSDKKLRSISRRLQPIQQAIGPLLDRTESAFHFVGQIEGVLALAKAVLRKFEELRALEVTLVRKPKNNLETYLSVVHNLDECIGFIKKNSGSATKLWKDATETVVQKDAVGKARGLRLAESIALLKSHREGKLNGVWTMYVLLGIALEKLAKEFKRIMVQHTLLLTLPDCLDPANTKDFTEQIILPPVVLKHLQAIMQNLNTNGGLEKCVESYLNLHAVPAFNS